MNPDSTRTKPFGIEVEFDPSEIALVAHIPAQHGGRVYWLADPGRLIGDESEWRSLDRAIIRAILLEALHRLDETEPTSTIGVGR